MPDMDRERFLAEDPTVICSDDKGLTVGFLGRPEFTQGIIILRYDLVNRPEFINTVAHEAVHIVLGHHNKTTVAFDLRYEEEKGADDRSASWGFKRCYSTIMLNKLKVGARGINKESW